MRIRSQLIVSAGVAVVAGLLTLAVLVRLGTLNAERIQHQADARDVLGDVAGLLTLTNEVATYGSERASTQWTLRYAQLLATVDRASERAPSPALADLRTGLADLPPLFDRLVAQANEPPSELRQRRHELLVERLLAQTQEVIETEHRWSAELDSRQAREQRLFDGVLVATPAALLVVLGLLGAVVARRVLAPLGRIERAVDAMRAGDLSARCDVSADDEIGDTARAVDAMAGALSEREAALAASEVRLKLLTDNVPALISTIDADRRYTYVNRRYRDWHRVAEIDIVGRRVDDFYGPAERAVYRPHMDAAFRGEVASYDLDVVTQGHARSISVTLVPDLDDEGRVRGLYKLATDVTALRRTARQLQASNAELEQFAYVASHDLQEPLRMVTSYTQLLVRRHAERLPDDAREFLGYIEDGGKRAQALIGDLLSLARVSSQGRPLEPTGLADVLSGVLSGLRLAIEEAGATVTHDDPLPVVMADRRQLAQLLQNLLTNALKFRGEAVPTVHIGVRRDDEDAGRWRILVRDNGIGIDPKFHQRVFVLFQRLHLRGEYAGTGIGLAICKKVVERHGGRIGVDSVPGQGATFWFTLADAQEAA